MPKRTSDHGKHNRTPLLGGLKDSMNALAADLGLSKPKKHDTNPFGDALQETSERKGGIIDELTNQFERALIQKALAHTGGRRIEAATLLGWGRNTLTRKIQELGMDSPALSG